LKITTKQLDELVAQIFEELDNWERNDQPYSVDQILSIRRLLRRELGKWTVPA